MRKLELPEFDGSNPYAHIDFIFAEHAKLKRAKATAEAFMITKKNYIKFLETFFDPSISGDYDVRIYWDEFSFINYFNYLTFSEYGKALASSTKSGLLYRFKEVLDFARQNGFTKTDFFLSARIELAVRETEMYEPYQKFQLDIIDDILEKEFELVKTLVPPQFYTLQNVGEDPRESRITPSFNPYRDRNNQIWYFENVLHCRPVATSIVTAGVHKKFVKYVGNMEQFYSSLGILPFPSLRAMTTIALKLIRLLGLNVSSLLSLTITSLSVDIKGNASLDTFKARSGGVISIPINKEDYPKVKELIDKAIDLTKCYRGKDNVILFLSMKATEIFAMTDRHIIRACAALKNRYDLNFTINSARLRASFASSLFINNVPILEAQSKLSHRNHETTLRYASKNHLEGEYQKQVSLALNGIYLRQLPLGTGTIYKTQIGYCLNPFAPPFLQSHVAMPCKAYNKCLSCSNYRVTANDLPNLFRFYLNISSSIEYQNRRLPNQNDYELTLKRISDLFLSGNPLEADTIRQAMSLAINHSGEVIDPTVEK